VKTSNKSTLCVFPHKTVHLSETWVLERVGPDVYLWATMEAYQKGLQHAVHTQHFESDSDASGAQHLFTEAVSASIRQHAVDLRDLCFWEDTSGTKVSTGKCPPGISLASLFHKKST
jgi:hypothetical protein